MDRQHVKNISGFFHQLTPLIIDAMGGHTYQAGTIAGMGGRITEAHHATNRLISKRAGLRHGQRVLDAGCGSGGPAVDIAREIGDLTIEAVTISPDQAEAARAHVAANDLADRITVRVADYHELPFPDGWFDAIYFLESACYSPDHSVLFPEVFRVLRPGGQLYVKDWFADSGELSPVEERALAELNELYVTCVRPIEYTAEAMTTAGFTDVRAAEERVFDSTLYKQAMVKPDARKQAKRESGSQREAPASEALTEFGQAHLYPLALQGVTPMYVSELWAVRPPTS